MAHSGRERPQARNMTKSFTRLDHPSRQARSRTLTLNQSASSSTSSELTTSPLDDAFLSQDDILDRNSMPEREEALEQDSGTSKPRDDTPQGFDDLPIEIISLIDRFIDSLSAKVHITPPSIEKLTDIFQAFYTEAESAVATHISALSTRQSGPISPKPLLKSTTDSKRIRTASGTSSEQQMLTPQEIDERRKARRLLDERGTAMEEAVERRVCERVYRRIWRHRSTLDEVMDEKLRSRTAALALVGIGMRDLGINLDKDPLNKDLESEIEEYVSKARWNLLHMNEARFPLGKLQQLAAAHKNIVDLLTALHQSSSSADEILPTLIYTLIGTPPEGINVISNLCFIQRFRAASKVDGEAAYCLTNLEAAVKFVETVDLATLRSDEVLDGPLKSRPTTPLHAMNSGINNTPTSMPSPASEVPQVIKDGLVGHSDSQSTDSRPTTPMSPSHHRRLSSLFQPPKDVLEAAGDAVRNTADQGLRNIGSTLDSSFNLLFGRLREQNIVSGTDREASDILPKTLDDAAKLVGPMSKNDDDTISTSQDGDLSAKRLDMLVSSTATSDGSLSDTLAGRNAARDRSIDSLQSAASDRKPITGLANDEARASSSHSVPQIEGTTNTGTTRVESMRNLGNTLNPLKGFGGMSVMRTFGRSSSSATPAPASLSVGNDQPAEPSRDHRIQTTPISSQHLTAKIPSPNLRFISTQRAEDLRIADVSELLVDYKRLVMALSNMGAFEAQVSL